MARTPSPQTLVGLALIVAGFVTFAVAMPTVDILQRGPSHAAASEFHAAASADDAASPLAAAGFHLRAFLQLPAQLLGGHAAGVETAPAPLQGVATPAGELSREVAAGGASLSVGLVSGGASSTDGMRTDDAGANLVETPGFFSIAAPASAAVAAFTVAGTVAYFWSSVKTWAWRLLALPLMPLYARISRAEALDNKVRQGIFEAIKADPGMSASALAKHFDISWGTTMYHLEVLEQTRLVSSLREGRYRRYFVNGAELDGASKETVAILCNETTAQVADAVHTTPGATQKEVARAVGLTPQALHWHMRRLVEAGLVRKEREGRVVRHYTA